MIFEFETYRDILRNEISRRTEENPLYSAHSFAKKIGMSQSYLSLILNNKRNLSEKNAEVISDLLNYSPAEKEYFLCLVKQESTENRELGIYFQDRIRKLKKINNIDRLDIEKFKIISDWYYSAILECVNLTNIKHSFESYAEHLNISEEIVIEAIKRLCKLGLLKKQDNKYSRTDNGYITTTPEIKSQALRKFHKQALKKAIQAIDQENIKDRNISGITMSIDPKKLPEAKKRVQAFMEDLMDFLEDGDREEVYQFSTQLFKLKEYPKEI